MKNTEVIGDIGAHDFTSVISLVQDYCDGLYQGDVSKLRAIFHSDVFLKAAGIRRSLEQWLDAVASRPVPVQERRSYDFNLLSIEIIKDQAMVKLECPLFDHFYVDYLGLLKENGRWLIVSKMYTDLQGDIS